MRFVITNRDAFDSARLGLEIAAALQKLYPGKIDFDANKKLIGSAEVITRAGGGRRSAGHSAEDGGWRGGSS